MSPWSHKIPRLFIVVTASALIVSSVAVLPAPAVHAAVTSLGNMLTSAVNGDTLTLTVDNGAEPGDDILVVQAVQNGILKVDYRPNGVASSPDTPMLDPNKTWAAIGATINTTSNPMTITTPAMKIEISKSPVRMTVKKPDGTTLLSEPSSGGVYSDGLRFVHSPADNMYGIRSFNAFDGGGDLLRNSSNHAAHAGEQGDSGGPLIWSTAGYGVLVDSDGGYPYTEEGTGKLEFYYGGTPVEGRRYTKQDVEYYIMLGTPKEVMSGVAEITGKPPMLPKWALGFMNFEWDTNQTETTTNVDLYRAKNIPIDGYAIDYDWKKYGENNYGEFAWNTANFPSASTTALKTAMTAKGIKMIGITKPRIVTKDASGNATVQGTDAANGGYFYPGHNEYQDYFIPVNVRSIDPYNAAQRTWFWNQSKDAFDKGIVGWWNDETDKVSSGSASYWFGNFTTAHMSQALYEGQRAYTSGNQRVWQTARTFYPGAQRFATTLWSGDIGIQYNKGERLDWAAGMQEQRAVMLSSINNGQVKWGMDVGGFNQQDGMINNPNPDLYTRWVQFSALTPVFRAHGNNHQQRQPWYYGPTAEEASKAAIQLRYSLIPYMYAYERSAFENGNGLVRPLMQEYPGDAQAKNYTDAWMFGDWLLAAPVVDKQQTIKDIYLPAGTWIDYSRGNVLSGGGTIRYPVNPDTLTDIPLFIKKGAIIPSQKVQDYVGQAPVTTVDVDVFPNTTPSSFTYYDDDGGSYNYESGAIFKQAMTAQDNGAGAMSFNLGAKNGTYTPPLQSYIVKLHGAAGNAVTSNGAAMTSYGSLQDLKAAAGEGWAKGKDVYGDVTYVKLAAGAASAKAIAVSGSSPASAADIQYEAEEASLSGNTVATKAAVNTNRSGYTGSGFVDGLSNPGAAVTFYPKVKAGGDYNVSLRYGNSTGSAKAVSIFVNGKRVKSTSLPNLASWNTWGTQSEVLPLTAGTNIVTYKFYSEAGDTGGVNLDNVSIPLSAAVGKYEAESAELTGGSAVNQNHWFYSGTGFTEGMSAAGSQVKFTVQAPAAGGYQLALRYANGSGSAKSLSTYVNGAKVGQNNFASPGANWNVWQDNIQNVTLSAGANTIAFKYDAGDSGNINLDRLLLSSAAPGTPVSELNLLDNGSFERDSGQNSNWAEWHPDTQAVAYGVDSGSTTNPPESPWAGDKRAYFFAAGAYKQSIHQTVNVPVNNAKYKFEAWVRMKNATPTIARAEIQNYGGSPVYANITGDGTWKYISVSDIQVTNGQIDIGFYVDSPGGTTLHIDDVRVTKQ
ncbi:TIM-barrel domain-containing protein [Paenibacillus herberti]|uniref:Glycosyl hydrolase family 31 n=1 Tax=Paenibacillus herberti TaxID=1619309 RepID=A0A229NY33_9BACL|nr:TIM-barrel domain-containing protein [Paenibacillus herberti]OXM14808.1 glycosyl hydrolase family 31 [Paenibacillus herberti]